MVKTHKSIVSWISRRSIVLAGCMLLAPALAMGQPADWPNKPIKFIVGYPPGGGADIVARFLSDKLPKILGQPVVIDNRTGAGGTIAAGAVARSEPDGYTFLVAASSEITIAPATMKSPGYNAETDFQPVALVARWPYLLVVSSASQFNTLGELIAYAKANPGKLSYSSFGNNTANHLTGELFKAEAKIDALHVPYRGSGPSLADLMGGQIQFTFDSPLTTLSLIQGGKLKPLAVTGAQRLPELPNVPTLAQAGVNGVIGGAWVGVLGPEKTPKPIVDKLNKAINEALNTPELKQAMESRGIQPLGGTPDDIAKQIKSEIAGWRDVVQRFGITPE
ncbi:tripartite tricarboxylate transporter substrate binding protein [Aquabacter sp. CN5-332]|uniref:Bug family tripartite tricarboxylate transporter substrate binding protein n=1 Tax=Aquabacter sp. CN5-332 TaxID=3156608 RepID=UPI0032B3EE74